MKKQLLLGAFLLGSIFTINAQVNISFESSEGYTLGEIDGQNNWSLSSASTVSADVIVTNDYASNGTNSLKLVGTNSQSQTLLGAYSPIYNVPETGIYEVAFDFRGEALGESDAYISMFEYDGTALSIAARIVFNYQGNIRIVTGLNPAGTALVYNNYGTFNAGTWYNVRVKFDNDNQTIEYFINNVSVYNHSMYNGLFSHVVGFAYDNYASGYNIDNFSIQQPSAGLQENLLSQLSVFPNPTSNVINISNSNNILVDGIEIIDLNGRTVKTVKFDGVAEAQVNVSDLSAGVYMMNISSDKGSVTKKIVKQ